MKYLAIVSRPVGSASRPASTYSSCRKFWLIDTWRRHTEFGHRLVGQASRLSIEDGQDARPHRVMSPARHYFGQSVYFIQAAGSCKVMPKDYLNVMSVPNGLLLVSGSGIIILG
jgi:hypothetical protein